MLALVRSRRPRNDLSLFAVPFVSFLSFAAASSSQMPECTGAMAAAAAAAPGANFGTAWHDKWCPEWSESGENALEVRLPNVRRSANVIVRRTARLCRKRLQPLGAD